MDTGHPSILERFPDALRGLIEAELAAGNAIIEAGGGHPAPPAGEMIKLAGDLRTPLPPGLCSQVRNTSLHHAEVTDTEGLFWVLTAPHAPPLEPDMDAIRAACAPVYAPPVVRTFPPGSIEMDHRGEMLILHEAERRTDIIWTWNRGNRLYRSSLSPWWYPGKRRWQPMTEEEKEAVIARFMEYARRTIGGHIELHD